MPIQKLLIFLGFILIISGIFLPWLLKLGLGHLPGDIFVKNEKMTFYFPIMTCIVISVMLSVIFWLMSKW